MKNKELEKSIFVELNDDALENVSSGTEILSTDTQSATSLVNDTGLMSEGIVLVENHIVLN